jgi:hypothetical protein
MIDFDNKQRSNLKFLTIRVLIKNLEPMLFDCRRLAMWCKGTLPSEVCKRFPQTEKHYFVQGVFFPCEKCAEMSDIFIENL